MDARRTYIYIIVIIYTVCDGYVRITYLCIYIYRGEIKYTFTARKTTGGGPKEIYGV